MKAVLPLFVFIDACGWEIIKADPFVLDLAPNRKKLVSVFGYSSACVPSILSGRWPAEHRNWSYFVYDPEHSPFGFLRPLRWLPRQLTSRRFFRRRLSSFLKARLNFQGYFDLYNLPFEHISLFDFSEKRSPLQPGGMNSGSNIFDYLVAHSIPHHVSAPQKPEQANLAALLQDIRSERIDFAFLYWPGLDGLLHRVGNDSPEIAPKLRSYEQWIHTLWSVAQDHYEEIRLYVFSDHGMANCDVLLDLKRSIDSLALHMPKDYAVVYRKRAAACYQSPQGYSARPSHRRSRAADARCFFCRSPFRGTYFSCQRGSLDCPEPHGPAAHSGDARLSPRRQTQFRGAVHQPARDPRRHCGHS
jgi:hypothetical protein